MFKIVAAREAAAVLVVLVEVVVEAASEARSAGAQSVAPQRHHGQEGEVAVVSDSFWSSCSDFSCSAVSETVVASLRRI